MARVGGIAGAAPPAASPAAPTEAAEPASAVGKERERLGEAMGAVELGKLTWQVVHQRRVPLTYKAEGVSKTRTRNTADCHFR